jgi:CelD/BcsL family acetyltransferase involved in cellulose biosynthesis
VGAAADDWDVLELRDVPAHDRAGRPHVATPLPTGADWLLDAARARGHRVARWASQTSPYLRLPADGAALDATLSARFRANLRRRARRLVELHGPLRLERVRGGPGLARAFDDALRLEAAAWKGAAGTAIASDEVLRRRYRALAGAFAARGQLVLAFLRVGAARVASHFALLEDGVYSLFKPGYDPALAAFGPGHLLVHAVAHALVHDGARELDLLGDALPWKREWTSCARTHAFRYVFRPTLRGRLVYLVKQQLLPGLRGHPAVA